MKNVSIDKELLLRYVGTKADVDNGNLNNFICFGTNNKDICLGDKQTYMYRIIGITTDNVNTDLELKSYQMKIIKATPTVDKVKWSSSSGSVDWDSASTSIRVFLNDTFLKTIKGIVGTHNWSDLITIQKWYKGDNFSDYNSAVITTGKTNGKEGYPIGLIHMVELVMSSSDGYPYSNSWLHLRNGIKENNNNDSLEEWIMTNDDRTCWSTYSFGGDGTIGLSPNIEYPVRPVFFLTRDISISGGGTETNPFIISDKIIT